MKNKKAILLFILGLCFIVPTAASEEMFFGASAKNEIKINVNLWDESLDNLRSSVEVLLKKNDEFVADNALLKNEVFSLQKSLEEGQTENSRLEKEPSRLTVLSEENNQKAKAIQKALQVLSKEHAAILKKNEDLKKKLSRLEEKQKPWEESIAALTEKEQVLGLDLELLKSMQGESPEALAAKLEETKKTFSALKEQEKEWQAKIRGLGGEKLNLLKDIERLAIDNRRVSQEIAQVNGEKDTTLKQIERLKSNAQDVPALERLFNERNSEKNALMVSIESLESEIAMVSGSEGEEVSSMTDQDLQTETATLVTKVSDLQFAFGLLKRENVMLEELLRVSSGEILAPEEEGDVDYRTAEAMGYAYASQGLYARAIAQYQKALKSSPHKKDIYFNLGFIYKQVGNIREAIKSYQSVLRIDSRDQEARQNISQLKKELSQVKASPEKDPTY